MGFAADATGAGGGSRRRAASALSPSKANHPNANANAETSSQRKPKPKSKDVASRYLSPKPSPSPAAAAPSSSLSSASAFCVACPSPSSARALTPSRRFASPTPAARRAQSVARARKETLEEFSAPAEPLPAAATTTATRRLSVSFQGEPFFLQTSHAKPSPPPAPPRNACASPEHRRPDLPPARPVAPREQQHYRWPSARAPASSSSAYPLTKSFDSSFNAAEIPLSLRRPISTTDDGAIRRASMDAADFSTLLSDTESISSGSNSVSAESGIVDPRVPSSSRRGTPVPVPRRLQDPLPSPRTSLSVKKSMPYSYGSSHRPPLQPPHPSPRSSNLWQQRAASPSRGRTISMATTGRSSLDHPVKGFAAEAAAIRRARHRGGPVDQEHLLRLLDTRYLQWRYVNAQADAALRMQNLAAEKDLVAACITLSDLHESVVLEKLDLQAVKQKTKLTTILKAQMACLEKWSNLEMGHSSCLSGLADALKSNTLAIPITNGAKVVDIQDLKNSISSAVDVLHSIMICIRPLLSNSSGMIGMASALAEIVRQERMTMEQSRELLIFMARLHVKCCSLQCQQLQLAWQQRSTPDDTLR